MFQESLVDWVEVLIKDVVSTFLQVTETLDTNVKP